MNGTTTELAQFVAGLKIAGSDANVPADVVERAKTLIADTIGISIRARYDADSTEAVMTAIDRLGLSGGSASVFGEPRSFTPLGAAIINGTLAHSLDFDDTHASASTHSSAPIMPAALAAAEMCGASGADVVAGVIAGYEVQLRLALALVPKDHYERGFHPTATCGVFGAAAAAGRVMGLSALEIENAFGAAGSQASGSMQFLANGSWNKRFHVGHACGNGLMAATLASQGYKGSSEAFEGKAGFLRAYAPNPKIELATKDLGKQWQTLNLAVKPYPTCRYSHAAMDALIDLRNTNDVKTDDIESVEIGLPKMGWKIIGDPVEAKQAPTNVVDGQFSMPFCAAVALREGKMAWDDYDRHLTDADTMSLCKRINTVVDARPEAEFPVNMSAVVRLTTKAGEHEAFVIVPKGEPSNFVSAEEISSKFMGLVEPYLSQSDAKTLLKSLLSLDKKKDIKDIMAISRAAQIREVA